MHSPKEVILLVKPQFEVGREKIGKKGVVRDSNVQAEAIQQVITSGQQLGWHYRGLTWSDTVGPAGNIEYLLWMKVEANPEPWPTLEALYQLTQAARQAL